MNGRTKLFGIAVVGLSLVAALTIACGDESSTNIEHNGANQMTGISVAGEGKVTAAPDVANISLGVSVLAPTVAEARQQAAASLEAMLATMRNNGVDDKDIQTSQLSIYPEYDYRNNESILRGFRVLNSVNAKIRDIDTTGRVVDEAVEAGGNNAQIQGISFTIDDPSELQEQARKAAVEDAKRKAEVLASAAGVSVGGPISISEGALIVPPIYYGAERAAADSAAPLPETPIEPGELDVSISVTVVWAIE